MKRMVIVVGSDGSSSAGAAVGDAAAIAGAVGGELHLVSAYVPAPRTERDRARRRLPAGLDLEEDDDRRAGARAVLDDLQDALGALDPALRVRGHAVAGDPVRALCGVAERVGADLLVVGNKGSAGMRAAVRSPVCARVRQRSSCPVLVIDTEPYWRAEAGPHGARAVRARAVAPLSDELIAGLPSSWAASARALAV